MTILSGLFEELDNLDWTRNELAMSQVASLLEKVDARREEVREELSSTQRAELERRAARSHETSTHYKWYLHDNPSVGYVVWLHEYKGVALRRPGFAEVPHNHRYWLTSLILAGGFQHNLYSVETEGDDILHISVRAESDLSKGTVYSVDSDDIHALSEIQDPTLTFIVQSPAAKSYSEVFNSNTMRVERHVPFSSRIDSFKSLVRVI